MKIERIKPAPPPPPPMEITMTFPIQEGWTIVAALREFATNHPRAWERQKWVDWAKDLEKELRRG